MMAAWSERPVDLANLLNPAFTGALLRMAVDGYARETGTGMPFPLAFLVLPFSMHHGTAERLPRQVTTLLQTWLQENRDVLIKLPDRVRTLVPFTREAVVFAAQRDVLGVGEDGALIAGDKRLSGLSVFEPQSDEVKEAIKRATFVGRWLALSGSPATLYALLGVRP